MGSKPAFQPIHLQPYTTTELMERLEPYQSRKMTDQELVKKMCDQEKRFYKTKEQAESEHAQVLNMRRKKHAQAWSDKEEAAKLMRLESELSQSKELVDIPMISDMFER
jgi:hypothetical protein